ncbi:glycosyl transferase [Clostridia bacterium]|nr:glycosyl transferase [Clostridia bacterium]GHV35137.1 glycosyl transferase [Clostridia bacterium]
MVSIIMSAYKSQKTIAESVASVLLQTYADWELLIVSDDCDYKDILPIDHRIILVQNETRLELSASRNKGVVLAKGDWIAFLDSDDVWHCSKLEKQLQFMSEHNARISYTASAFMHSDYVMPAVELLDFKTLLRRNIMPCSSVIVERELIIKHPFPCGVITEDFASWLSIVREVGFATGLGEPLLWYRLSEGSDSSSKIHMAVKTYRAYRFVGINPVKSIFLIVNYARWTIKKRGLILKGLVEDGL